MVVNKENPNPGFYYGYVVSGALFITMVVVWGAYYSFGVFFDSLQTEFGWTRAEVSGAFSLSSLVFGVAGVVTGRLSDRFGPRMLSAVCGLFLGAGFILMSRVDALWQVYLIYLGLISVGMSSSWSPIVATVARWFYARRGMMTGIVISGIGLGTVVIVPLASRLITAYGWQTSYIVIGSIVIVVTLLASQFLRRSPAEIGKLPYGASESAENVAVSQSEGYPFREIIRTWQFWTVVAIYFCFGICLHTIIVHIVPHAIDLGILPVPAANILAVSGGFSILGRIIIGSASDRRGARVCIILVLVLIVLALLWLQVAGELWALYLFAVVFGFAYGGLSAMQSVIAAELFGLKAVGFVTGNFSGAYLVGGAIGPVLAGYLFDVSGSYGVSFLICASLMAVSIILALLVRPVK